MENGCKYMYAHANSSTVYNGHKEETAQRSTNSWMRKQNVVSPYSRVLLIQRNEVLVPATTWMNFENVTLSARSQTQKVTPFSLLCLSVRLGTKHKAVQHQALALNSSQCQELANYYFGFSGWSKGIIKLQDLSDLEERENEDATVPLQKQSLKFFCALEVVLPSYECRSPGVGMAEEPLEKLEEESGKIAVEYRPCEEITDARTEEELQDLIQVSYFSWKQDGRGEEEWLSDLSFEEAEFKPPELD
ncbi:RAD52 motif-containing protein 1-like [Halichoerus grypus]